MIDFVYQTLAGVGYTHPLHPILTHVPIGMVIGVFLFALVARIVPWVDLAQTARHCVILTLVLLIPTAILGYWDWQHFYGGAALFPIKMKIVLACLLFILLILSVVFGIGEEIITKSVFIIYFCCLLTAVGLGYFGGELVYATQSAPAEAGEGQAAEGAAIFQQNCSACHFTDNTASKIGPGLQGLFKRDKFTVSGQPVSEDNFRDLLKTPFDKMPPFGHLTPEQVDMLVAYVKTL